MIVLDLSFSFSSSLADVILDSDFFSTIPHTLVTFETDGEGNQVIIAAGDERAMPVDEYAALGFTFPEEILWVNTEGFFDQGQTIGGSLDISISKVYKAEPFLPSDYYIDIDFLIPLRAFGFWVVHNPVTESPTFTAYGTNGVIETAVFEGDAIDGSIGQVNYGFLGITAQENITRIRLTEYAATLDNFTHSPVPEPATISLLGMGMFLLKHRKGVNNVLKK